MKAELLKQLAAQVDLKRFASSPKAKKKPKPERKKEPNRTHFSTARLLAQKERDRKLSQLNQQTNNVVKTPTPQGLRS
jgi:hypothetical protein